MEFIIKDTWKLVKRLGAGSFGEIFLGIDLRTQQQVAAKLEDSRSESKGLLENEYAILRALDEGKATGISKVFWFGQETILNRYTVLIMECLGPSLEDLLNYCGNKFCLKTTLMLADQMIRRIQHVHERCFLHRDIKPDNFLMGTQKQFTTVYVIDFGLSKRYIDPHTKRHIPFSNMRSMTGTARYCSIKAHEGQEQSRRDDLEALGYVFVYFVKGELPWQGAKGKDITEKFKNIHKMKMMTTPKMLCAGLPNEFSEYLTYCRKLQFEEAPNYKYLRGLFHSALKNASETYDFNFDWMKN